MIVVSDSLTEFTDGTSSANNKPIDTPTFAARRTLDVFPHRLVRCYASTVKKRFWSASAMLLLSLSVVGQQKTTVTPPALRPSVTPVATGKWVLDRVVDKMDDSETLTITLSPAEGSRSLRVSCPKNRKLYLIFVGGMLPTDRREEYELVQIRFDKESPELQTFRYQRFALIAAAIGGSTEEPTLAAWTADTARVLGGNQDIDFANTRNLLLKIAAHRRLSYRLMLASTSGASAQTEGSFDLTGFAEAFRPLEEHCSLEP